MCPGILTPSSIVFLCVSAALTFCLVPVFVKTMHCKPVRQWRCSSTASGLLVTPRLFTASYRTVYHNNILILPRALHCPLYAQPYSVYSPVPSSPYCFFVGYCFLALKSGDDAWYVDRPSGPGRKRNLKPGSWYIARSRSGGLGCSICPQDRRLFRQLP